MRSKCPGLNCVYVEYKRLGQRQKYMTAAEKNTYCIWIDRRLCGTRSNEVNGEKSAVVQRTVLSQRIGDDKTRCISPLLPVCYRSAAPPVTRLPLSGPAL